MSKVKAYAERMADIYLELVDLVNMARLAEGEFEGQFIGPDGHGRFITDRRSRDIMDFAWRDVRGRAEILLEKADKLHDDMERAA